MRRVIVGHQARLIFGNRAPRELYRQAEGGWGKTRQRHRLEWDREKPVGRANRKRNPWGG